jgi:hypothetical protein
MKFRIYTGGPVITQDFSSVAAVRKYVEKYAPLKNGWTGKWACDPTTGNMAYYRSNSKGVEVTGYTIGVMRLNGTTSPRRHKAVPVEPGAERRARNPHDKFDGHFVTVELDSGDMFVGTLAVVNEDTVAINSGFVGRPKVVHVDDIEEILLANAVNPHIEAV